MKFEDYWNNYGELHASMCNGDIKVFARDIWESAIGTKQTEIDNLKSEAKLKEYIRENFSPDDVFSEAELDAWAEHNGWIKEGK